MPTVFGVAPSVKARVPPNKNAGPGKARRCVVPSLRRSLQQSRRRRRARGNDARDPLGIAADAVNHVGRERIQEVQADEVQPGLAGNDARLVHGVAVANGSVSHTSTLLAIRARASSMRACSTPM